MSGIPTQDVVMIPRALAVEVLKRLGEQQAALYQMDGDMGLDIFLKETTLKLKAAIQGREYRPEAMTKQRWHEAYKLEITDE